MEIDIGHGGAALAGLASFASPCVLPIVPSYLCFLAGVSLEDLAGTGVARAGARTRVVLSACVFALGFATVFVLLGATATAVGQALSRHLDLLRWLAGGIIIAMGLHFLGLVGIPLLNRHLQVEVGRRPTTFAGRYLVGMAFGFGWTPCVGPVLAAILFLAGAKESAWQGATLLAAYALGMALPFVGFALFAPTFASWMRPLGRHTAWLGRAIGIALVATGLLFWTGSIPHIAGWMITYLPAQG